MITRLFPIGYGKYFRHLGDTDIYIDDVGAFYTSWTAHIKLLDEILRIFKDNGFIVNPLKCEWSHMVAG